MADGVLVCDADGRVVLANQAATTILGESVDGYAELVARLEPGEGALPALGTSAPPVEVRVRGQDRWIEVTSARVAGDSGDPKAPGESTILVLRDVTAARQTRRPPARRSSASCRTSCGRRSPRSTATPS